MGDKDYEIMVSQGSRKINEEWKTVDLKTTREIPPSGRMAGVGAHVAHRRLRVGNSLNPWLSGIFDVYNKI